MPDSGVTGTALPFDEAIDFFRGKVNVPTRTWTDIWNGAHARAFMIAGAMRAELLNDFRKALDKSIQGGSFRQFQKDFDSIVARHGWQYNGDRGWRTSVIYRTNMRSAYQAGRYRQMTDPDVLRYRPYWRYVHGDSKRPRPEHLAWHGLVLPADDPFWKTHYPSNGWGCSCRVEALSERQLKKLGKNGPDKSPKIETKPFTNPSTGNTEQVPKGIDPGFAFNVGRAAHGRPLAEAVIKEHAGGKWVHKDGKGPKDYGRGDVPADKPKAKLGPKATAAQPLVVLFERALGGQTVRLKDAAGDWVVLDKAITDHISKGRLDGREQYFPFIKEVIENPFEIWASFAENEQNGKYGLRRNYVKFFDLGDSAKSNRTIGVVAEAVNGVWTGVTVFRGRPNALKNLRKGVLVYGRQ